MNPLISETMYWIIFAIPSILIASTVHEYAHAITAVKLGDPTPKAHGRLTLNPLAHIDPIGAISMIILRFGWSKPVPINPRNFDNERLGIALTSLAGPVSNILLLLLTALVNHIFKPYISGLFFTFLLTFAMVNLVLAIFNLIPIPPLDGHKIVGSILPKKLAYYWDNLEKYYIPLILILVLPIFKSGSIASFLIGTLSSKILLLLGFF
ncbi:MAG TPA: site-2 protease family protein [Candidatus Dojkabacteria bacterium]|nr:site-2 protease family protein [Candidatus Dojkabacteria bacterium]